MYRSDRGATRTAKVNWARGSPSRRSTFTQAIALSAETHATGANSSVVSSNTDFGIWFAIILRVRDFFDRPRPDYMLPAGSARGPLIAADIAELQAARLLADLMRFSGTAGWTRTTDLLIHSQAL